MSGSGPALHYFLSGLYQSALTKNLLSKSMVVAWAENEKGTSSTKTMLSISKTRIKNAWGDGEDWQIDAELTDLEHRVLSTKTWRTKVVSMDLDELFDSGRAAVLPIP